MTPRDLQKPRVRRRVRSLPAPAERDRTVLAVTCSLHSQFAQRVGADLRAGS